jgi:hypothetical protein
MIAVFISEEQILRNYLVASDWQVFPEDCELLILSDSYIHNTLSKMSTGGSIPKSSTLISIDLNAEVSRIGSKLVTLLRTFSSSPSVYRQIRREFELNQISCLAFVVRCILHFASHFFPSLQSLFRFFLYHQLKNRSLSKIFKERRISHAVSFAITNPEDVIFLSCAKRAGIKTVATTRSWDNLSSHGALLFEPDVFISHSQLMLDQLCKYHRISNNCDVVQQRVPWYQVEQIDRIRPKSVESMPEGFKILYACTGPYHFPNEVQYIGQFFEIVKYRNMSMCVLQHPKSLHDLSLFPSDLVATSFPFIDDNGRSTLESYYRFINSFTVIVGSGSTVLLDAKFLGKPVVGFFPENLSLYWSSIARYADTMEHYSQFLKRLEVPVALDVNKLVKLVSSPLVSKEMDQSSIKYFTGDDSASNFNLSKFISQN